MATFTFTCPQFSWSSPLVTAKCLEGHCNTMVSVGLPYCPVHTEIHYGVKVAESTIAGAGLGLFATRRLKKDQVVCPYLGGICEESTIRRLYGLNTAVYAVQLTAGVTENADICRGIGSLCNHKTRGFNCRLAKYKHRTVVRAVRDIKAGTELFVSYGSDYRFQPDVQAVTTYHP